MAGKIKTEAAALPRRCAHRAPLLWLVVPLASGGILERMGTEWPWGSPVAAGVVGAVVALGAVARPRTGAAFPAAHRTRGDHLREAIWTVGICAAMGLAGLALFARANRKIILPPRGEPVVVDVAIRQLSPPRAGAGWPPRRLALATGLGEIVAGTGPAGQLRGEMLSIGCVIPPGDEPVARDSIVRLAGTLKLVSARGGADSFNGYLRGRGVKYVLSPAWVRKEIRPPPFYAQAREAIAARMQSILAQAFASRGDLAAIYRAMMLGRKDGLTASQKELFLRTGTMHLFAINGLHIGVVAVSMQALLALLRVPRGLGAVVVTLGVLWVDVDATGGSPSALRSFVMVGVVAAGRAAGLPVNPLAALVGAAAVLIAIDPADLFSASFQLSFSVVLSLLLLGVPLAEAAATRLPRPIAASLGFGAAATAVSAITGVIFFATISFVGLPANLLLMPLASLVIVAGFAAVLAGLVQAMPVALIFNAAAGLLLRGLVAGLSWFAGLPVAAASAHTRAGWVGPAALLIWLALCFRGYARDWKGPRAYLPPFIAVALFLLLGVRYGA